MSLWIPPVRLTSLIVDHDPSTTEAAQWSALHRAVNQRLLDPYSPAPPGCDPGVVALPSGCRALDIFISNSEGGFKRGKAAAKHAHPIETLQTAAGAEAEEPSAKRRKKNPLSPCGASLNWYRSSSIATVPSSNRNDAEVAGASAGAGDCSVGHRPTKPRKLAQVEQGTVEVTIAHTGALQGSVKSKVGERSTASRLSPYYMRTSFEQTIKALQDHRHDSLMHEKMYQHIVTSLNSVVKLNLLDDADKTLDESGGGLTDKTLDILSRVQNLSRRDLKVLCGACYYNSDKEIFLKHPVFKDWICDN